MHAIAAAFPGRSDDGVDVEIATHRIAAGGADLARRAREPGVQRQGIGRREDGDRVDAERGRRPRDADGDLAAIGDQDALEHRFLLRFFRTARILRVSDERAGTLAVRR